MTIIHKYNYQNYEDQLKKIGAYEYVLKKLISDCEIHVSKTEEGIVIECIQYGVDDRINWSTRKLFVKEVKNNETK